ncbi:flavin reductase family protein, partial [Streptomyces sp. NPDC056437]
DLLPTSLAIVTGCAGAAQNGAAAPRGLTIASLTAVSEDPGLIGFLVKAESSSWASIAPGLHFCVNILSDRQADIARVFARTRPDLRFDGLEWAATANGCPRIAGAFGFIDCQMAASYRMGDHLLILGKVHTAEIDHTLQPLRRNGQGRDCDYGWTLAGEPAEAGADT